MTASKFTTGTVVRYLPDDRHDRYWCREGMAVVDDRGRLVDTYWGSGSEAHVLTGSEEDRAEVLFNLDDFDELDRWKPDAQRWATYAPEDRQRITMQHGLQQRLFIRKGAVPHRETVIENLRLMVADAEAQFQSAQRNLQFAREDLEALLAAPADCSCRPSLCAREACPACAATSSWTECKALPARLGGAA